MATPPTVHERATPADTANGASSGLLISLGALSPDGLKATLNNLAEAFPQQTVLVATPDPLPREAAPAHLELVTYASPAPSVSSWMLTAADYLNTWKLAEEHRATTCVLLGPESHSLGAPAVRALADAVLGQRADLATPHYDLGPHDGLVNSAILYPVTRSLFAARARYPLAVDLAVSARLAERLATVAQRYTAAGQGSALVWPVAESSTAGFSIIEVPAGPRALPSPGAIDLNTVLAQVAGSLFAEVDAKAAFWQRARLASPRNGAPPAHMEGGRKPGTHPASQGASGPESPDVTPMLESFRFAHANLHEIWSLVLPPNSLLGLKRLSLLPAESFRMPDWLWARIVYDFILAYHLRTLNRGHLLGALTPLYLAWAASHLLQTADGAPDHLVPESHVEAVAAAFEADKPYLVSRWRWPDRFNP